eukprot:m.20008 g.20008  ORF g.20008 m.20008 type:complete len:1295 (+) comp5204_c0_seq2:110-3994(+)
MSWNTRHLDIVTYSSKPCEIITDTKRISNGHVVLIGYGLQILTKEPFAHIGVIKIFPGCFSNNGDTSLEFAIEDCENFSSQHGPVLSRGRTLRLRFSDNATRTALRQDLMRLSPIFVPPSPSQKQPPQPKQPQLGEEPIYIGHEQTSIRNQPIYEQQHQAEPPPYTPFVSQAQQQSSQPPPRKQLRNRETRSSLLHTVKTNPVDSDATFYKRQSFATASYTEKFRFLAKSFKTNDPSTMKQTVERAIQVYEGCLNVNKATFKRLSSVASHRKSPVCITHIRKCALTLATSLTLWLNRFIKFGKSLKQDAYSSPARSLMSSVCRRCWLLCSVLSWQITALDMLYSPSKSQNMDTLRKTLVSLFDVLEKGDIRVGLRQLINMLSMAVADTMSMVDAACFTFGRVPETVRDAGVALGRFVTVVFYALKRYNQQPECDMENTFLEGHCSRLLGLLLEFLFVTQDSTDVWGQCNFATLFKCMNMWSTPPTLLQFRYDEFNPLQADERNLSLNRTHFKNLSSAMSATLATNPATKTSSSSTTATTLSTTTTASSPHTSATTTTAATTMNDVNHNSNGGNFFEASQNEPAGMMATIRGLSLSVPPPYSVFDQAEGKANNPFFDNENSTDGAIPLKLNLSTRGDDNEDDVVGDEEDDEESPTTLYENSDPVEWNRRYLEKTEVFIDDTKKRLLRLRDPQVPRLSIATILETLLSISDKFVCVNTDHSNKSTSWQRGITDFYKRLKNILTSFERITVEERSPENFEATHLNVANVLSECQGLIQKAIELHGLLAEILKQQEGFRARKNSELKRKQYPKLEGPSATNSTTSPTKYHPLASSNKVTVTSTTTPSIALPVIEEGSYATIARKGREEKGQYQFPEDEVVYIEGGTGKKVMSASLSHIVERMTRPDRQDAAFNLESILTYHTFAATDEFLTELINRYDGALLSMAREKSAMAAQFAYVRFAVLNVLKRLIVENGRELALDKHQSMLRKFLSTKCLEKNEVDHLIAMLDAVHESKFQNPQLLFNQSGSLRSPCYELLEDRLNGDAHECTEFDILRLNVIQLAQQMCLWSYDTLVHLTPFDVLGKQADTSVVMALVTRQHEATTSWVTGSILLCSGIKDRVDSLKKFVRLAQNLLLLGNYDLFAAVYLGYSHGSIVRLKITWSTFQSKHRKSFGLMKEHEKKYDGGKFQPLISLMDNRELERIPCIPLYAHIKRSLCRINTLDNSVKTENNSTLINMKKRELMSRVMTTVKIFQQKPYEYSINQVICGYLLNTFLDRRMLKSKEAYDRSKQLEPSASSHA